MESNKGTMSLGKTGNDPLQSLGRYPARTASHRDCLFELQRIRLSSTKTMYKCFNRNVGLGQLEIIIYFKSKISNLIITYRRYNIIQ